MPTKWLYADVIFKEFISDSKLLLQIQSSDLIDLSFIPGQFITMDLPIGDKRQQRWRSYSIANIPNAQGILEFAIGRVPGGPASDYFFDEIKLNDQIKFKYPDGSFTLPESESNNLTFICTGTGVVPFISMLRFIHKNKLPFASLHLIYGTRFEKDILFYQELKNFEEYIPNFKLTISLSKPKENWKGSAGYVHSVYQKADDKFSEKDLFLICGWSNMIDEAVAYLFPKLPNPASQLKYELYG